MFRVKIFFIRFTGILQISEVAGNADQKFVFIVDHIEIGHLGVIQNVGFHAVAQRGLTLQQFSVFFIGFSIDVQRNQGIFVNRNHVIESKQAVATAV